MSDTLPAAATGLPAAPAFDRRSFLATLAAAGVLTGGSEAVAGENDELIVLGTMLEVQRETLRLCGARSDAAYAILPEEPDLPSLCHMKDGDSIAWNSSCATYRCEETGRSFHEWSGEKAVAMLEAYLAATAALAEPLAYFRARATAILEAIGERDAAIERDKEAAGVTATNAAEEAARDAMEATIARMIEMPARTLPGLLIKARAAAYSWSEPSDQATDYIEKATSHLAHAVRGAGLRPVYASVGLDLVTLAFSIPVAA